MKNLNLLVLTMAGFILGAGSVRAAEPTKAQLDFLEKVQRASRRRVPGVFPQ